MISILCAQNILRARAHLRNERHFVSWPPLAVVRARSIAELHVIPHSDVFHITLAHFQFPFSFLNTRSSFPRIRFSSPPAASA